MIGEIRDPETAQIAVQSALTGHLVFSTVHANNVFDVIGRFLHMGLDPYNFVSSLNCVAAQRLVRTICPNCKKSVKYPRQLLEESGLSFEKYREVAFYVGAGCHECHGLGFKGRTAIMELLDVDDEIREMIIHREPVGKIKKTAQRQGMILLRESALEKVFSGTTTLPEINRITFPEQVERQ
jgi:type IV pilus assembly protein PilB